MQRSHESPEYCSTWQHWIRIKREAFMCTGRWRCLFLSQSAERKEGRSQSGCAAYICMRRWCVCPRVWLMRSNAPDLRDFNGSNGGRITDISWNAFPRWFPGARGYEIGPRPCRSRHRSTFLGHGCLGSDVLTYKQAKKKKGIQHDGIHGLLHNAATSSTKTRANGRRLGSPSELKS